MLGLDFAISSLQQHLLPLGVALREFIFRLRFENLLVGNLRIGRCNLRVIADVVNHAAFLRQLVCRIERLACAGNIFGGDTGAR